MSEFDDQELPDYLQSPQGQVDPRFMAQAPGAEKKTAMEVYLDILKRKAEEKYQDSPDIKELRRQIELGPQRTENIHQAIKDQYGFRPDTTPKRIAATAIDSLMGILGGGVANKAGVEANKDYEAKKKSYEQLIGLSTKAQDESRKNQLDYLTGNAKAAMMEETATKNRASEEARTKQLDLMGKKLDMQAKINDTHAALMDAQRAVQEAKAKGLNTHQATIEEWNKNNPDMKWDVMTGMKGDALRTMLSNSGDPEKVNNLLRFANELSKANDKGQNIPYIKSPPTFTEGPGGTVQQLPQSIIGGGGRNRPDYTPNFQRQGGNPSNPLTPGLQLPSPIQSTLPQAGGGIPPKAGVLADKVLNGGDMDSEREKLVQSYLSNPGAAPTGTSKSVQGIIDAKKKWEGLNQRVGNISDVALSQLGGEGKDKLSQWVGPLVGSDFGTKVRNLSGGLSQAEINNKLTESLLELQHLKQVMGTRVPASIFQHVTNNLSNKLDDPETYTRRLVAQKSMIQLGQKMETDPRFNDIAKKLQDDYDKKKAAGYNVSGATFGEVEKELADKVISDSKNKKGVSHYSPDDVIREVHNRLKNAKPGGGNSKEESEKQKLLRAIGQKESQD